MLRGELAIAAIVIYGIVTLIDVLNGRTESVGVFLSILAVSGVLTGVSYLFRGRL